MAVIAVDPTDSFNDSIFSKHVSGTTAFYVLLDAGQTWSAILMPGIQGVADTGDEVFWLCIDPVATNLFVFEVAAGSADFLSTDSGATLEPPHQTVSARSRDSPPIRLPLWACVVRDGR